MAKENAIHDLTIDEIWNVPIPSDPEMTARLNSVIARWEDRVLGDPQEFEDLIMDTYHAGANAMKEAVVRKMMTRLNSVIARWEDRVLGDPQEFEDLIMDIYYTGADAMKEAIDQKILELKRAVHC
jgi:hypothetical protein